MSVRAKFTCVSMQKYESTVWDMAHQNAITGILYRYEFYPVTATSEENNRFFASTPTGSLQMSAVRDDLFVPGQSYYLDFTPAI